MPRRLLLLRLLCREEQQLCLLCREEQQLCQQQRWRLLCNNSSSNRTTTLQRRRRPMHTPLKQANRTSTPRSNSSSRSSRATATTPHTLPTSSRCPRQLPTEEGRTCWVLMDSTIRSTGGPMLLTEGTILRPLRTVTVALPQPIRVVYR